MNNQKDILQARSPAALAEEYLVKSIWNHIFPPGTALPAERDLAEKIGVTRTTLREVLQRLARDGWLTIQHGKPTRVNDIWETSGLHIIETIINLDEEQHAKLRANMRATRTELATLYIPKSFKYAKEQSLEILNDQDALTDDVQSYVEYDYDLFRKLAKVSPNPLYTLALNSFKKTYLQLGMLFFSVPQARQLAKKFYAQLRILCQEDRIDEVSECLIRYGRESADLIVMIEANIKSQ
ncbi:GntR family transcriptional regulator [Cricetibacter osteomyelitidis]|uniref:Fatty acid metabolism regulator protein n=1 Tax=Cricetibacter osteomyelitidis TaxID=1521931 RepID=A0A4R2T1R5_9PAST|nr:fatty acid metabolism transcriptional regulator FadR [Cricetibacter osteomyelitidis]TCP96829.1 GntR family transcriptional regulator [Cricetibacter osteomyelitidis]